MTAFKLFPKKIVQSIFLILKQRDITNQNVSVTVRNVISVVDA